MAAAGRTREWPPGSGQVAHYRPAEEQYMCALADAARASGELGTLQAQVTALHETKCAFGTDLVADAVDPLAAPAAAAPAPGSREEMADEVRAYTERLKAAATEPGPPEQNSLLDLVRLGAEPPCPHCGSVGSDQAPFGGPSARVCGSCGKLYMRP